MDRPRPVRHARGVRRRRAVRAVALTAVAVVAFGGTAVAVTWHHLVGNMETVDVAGLVDDIPQPTPTEPPDPDDAASGRPVNLLVLGSDQRDGRNAEIGGENPGRRSDTTLLVHVSADRTRVEVVSIPRDSLVDVPECPVTGGGTTRASEHTMFNEAFSRGWDAGQDLASAAACTVRTVHANTGVLADHAVVVDFAGFEDMVEAIGGVPICVPQRMRAADAGLDLPAGRHVLDGPTALAFARARDGEEGLGDGSDINRIGNQQRLVAAIVQEVLAKDVLTDVPQLTRFLSAGTSSLTVDEGLKGDALGLVYSLRSLRAEDITFVTVPWAQARSNKYKVEWTAEADELWANVAADRPALGTPGSPAGEPAGTAAPGGTAPDGTALDGTAPGGTAPGAGGSTATPGAATPPDAPAPAQTRRAGREPFTANDTTAVCG